MASLNLGHTETVIFGDFFKNNFTTTASESNQNGEISLSLVTLANLKNYVRLSLATLKSLPILRLQTKRICNVKYANFQFGRLLKNLMLLDSRSNKI